MRGARHVIFGAGAIGTTLAESLLNRGEGGVRLINRSGQAAVDDRAETVAGDAKDPAFTTAVAEGAQFVYQVLNPRYDRWSADFPPMQDAVLQAAEAAGARLISMENVYLYGRPQGHPFVESDRSLAHTRKGRLRGRMAEQLLEAHNSGRVEVVIGRASDYYGPRGGAQSQLGDRTLRALLHGKPVRVLGDPAQPHTYSYIPDIADGLAALALEPAAAGQVWHLPNDPAPATTAELVALAAEAAGLAAPVVGSLSPALLRVLGAVQPIMRELQEMQYEFEAPFLVDSTKIRDSFGLTATPYAEGAARTMHSHMARIKPSGPLAKAPPAQVRAHRTR